MNRRPQSRFTPQERQEASKNKKSDEDEDNWDLPEGDIPYWSWTSDPQFLLEEYNCLFPFFLEVSVNVSTHDITVHSVKNVVFYIFSDPEMIWIQSACFCSIHINYWRLVEMLKRYSLH